jgi:hypothetical protein
VYIIWALLVAGCVRTKRVGFVGTSAAQGREPQVHLRRAGKEIYIDASVKNKQSEKLEAIELGGWKQLSTISFRCFYKNLKFCFLC